MFCTLTLASPQVWWIAIIELVELRAANYAPKLTSMRGHSLWITKDVYKITNEELKGSNSEVTLWEGHYGNVMNSLEIYNSNAEYHF